VLPISVAWGGCCFAKTPQVMSFEMAATADDIENDALK